METTTFDSVDFFLMGMRRSGNHVFADWLKAHEGPWRHYNNCCDQDGDCLLAGQVEGIAGKVLATFEDVKYRNLAKVTGNKPVILLLRDPYNLFASRLKMIRTKPEAELDMICDDAFKIWKENAWAFMHEKVIVVSFNRWYSDQEYRKSISERLGLEFTDVGFGSKAGWKFSGGSSFGGEPDPMNSYHKNMARDEEFLGLFDVEVQQFAKTIFGIDPPEGVRYDQQWNEDVEKAVNHILKSLIFHEQPTDPTFQEIVKMYPASSRIRQLEPFFLPL